MSTQSQINNLNALRDTPANRQGQIDTQIQNLQANRLDVVQRNVGHLAVKNG